MENDNEEPSAGSTPVTSTDKESRCPESMDGFLSKEDPLVDADVSDVAKCSPGGFGPEEYFAVGDVPITFGGEKYLLNSKSLTGSEVDLVVRVERVPALKATQVFVKSRLDQYQVVPSLSALLDGEPDHKTIRAAIAECVDSCVHLIEDFLCKRDFDIRHFVSNSSLPFLEKNHIVALEKPSTEFKSAVYFCRICIYHLTKIGTCKDHLLNAEHSLEKQKLDGRAVLLAKTPKLAKDHYLAICSEIERCLSERILVNDVTPASNATPRILQLVQDGIECALNMMKTDTDPSKVKVEAYGSSVVGTDDKDSDINIHVSVADLSHSDVNELLKKVATFLEGSSRQGTLPDEVERRHQLAAPPRRIPNKNRMDFIWEGFPVDIRVNMPERTRLTRALKVWCEVRRETVDFLRWIRFWAKVSKLVERPEEQRPGLPLYAFDLFAIHYLLQKQMIPSIFEDPDPLASGSETTNASASVVNFEEDTSKIRETFGSNLCEWNIGVVFADFLEYYVRQWNNLYVQITSSDILPHPLGRYSKRLSVVDPFSHHHFCLSQHVQAHLYNVFLHSFCYLRVPGFSMGGSALPVRLYQKLQSSPLKAKAASKKRKPSQAQETPMKEEPTTATSAPTPRSRGIRPLFRENQQNASAIDQPREPDSVPDPSFSLVREILWVYNADELEEDGLDEELEDHANGEYSRRTLLQMKLRYATPVSEKVWSRLSMAAVAQGYRDHPIAEKEERMRAIVEKRRARTQNFTNVSSMDVTQIEREDVEELPLEEGEEITEIENGFCAPTTVSDSHGCAEQGAGIGWNCPPIDDDIRYDGSNVLPECEVPHFETFPTVRKGPDDAAVATGMRTCTPADLMCTRKGESDQRTSYEQLFIDVRYSDAKPKPDADGAGKGPGRDLSFDFSEAKNFTGGFVVDRKCSVCNSTDHIRENCPDLQIPDYYPLEKPPSTVIESLECAVQSYFERESISKTDAEKVLSRVAALEADLAKSRLGKDRPALRLTVFGSYCSGIGIKNSDVDICLTFGDSTEKPKPNEASDAVMYALAGGLRYCKFANNVDLIKRAKVPIVKFHLFADSHYNKYLNRQPNADHWDADISYYNTLALHNSRLLSTYCRLWPGLKSLGIWTKAWAKKNGIGDAACGSISSYGHVLLLIYFLQQRDILPVLQEAPWISNEEPRVTCEGWDVTFAENVEELKKKFEWVPPQRSCAELFLEYLDFYCQFDFENTVVQIRRKKPLSIDEKRMEKQVSSMVQWSCSKRMYIEDPFDRLHNLPSGVTERMSAYIVRSYFHSRKKLFDCSESDLQKFVETREDGELADLVLNACRQEVSPPENSQRCKNCYQMGHYSGQCPRREHPPDSTRRGYGRFDGKGRGALRPSDSNATLRSGGHGFAQSGRGGPVPARGGGKPKNAPLLPFPVLSFGPATGPPPLMTLPPPPLMSVPVRSPGDLQVLLRPAGGHHRPAIQAVNSSLGPYGSQLAQLAKGKGRVSGNGNVNVGHTNGQTADRRRRNRNKRNGVADLLTGDQQD